MAAGDTPARDYSQVFLDFGIMLVGPGHRGNYFENRQAYADVRRVQRFVEEIKPGDVVVLKKGVKSIIAVGVVVERKDSYFHSEIFSDVEGFSLQHGRYVVWYKPKKEIEIRLPRGTVTSDPSWEVKKIADRIISENEPLKPRRMPSEAKTVDDEKLIACLVEHGLSSGQAKDVKGAFNRVRKLGAWYSEKEADVSEYETRTFLIVPLILALGWPEQRLKLEWRDLDMALFEKNYTDGASPMMILESKRLDYPLMGAEEQAKQYSIKFPYCNKLVVSNGIRYLLFSKERSEWKPKAYLDLLRPLDRHPYYEKINGAPDLLTQLLP